MNLLLAPLTVRCYMRTTITLDDGLLAQARRRQRSGSDRAAEAELRARGADQESCHADQMILADPSSGSNHSSP